MKLLRYTTSKLTILLLFLISIWGICFFLAIHHEIMDETDDMLKSYRDIFVKKALHDSSLLNSTYSTTFDRYSIRKISDEEATIYEESWLDSELYFPEGNEHIPVRVYRSIFLASDDQYYELEISMSTLERNDMIETLLVFLISLYVLLLVCILIGNRIILKRSFLPLNNLLTWLNSQVPGKPLSPLSNDTKIVEFEQLNNAAVAMSKRNLEVYMQQKNFIENASHELQTPLAVLQNKIELLVQGENLTEKQLSELGEMYNTINRASKLNKSLLLLSKIENQQFVEEEKINFNRLIDDVNQDMEDIYSFKKIDTTIDDQEDCFYSMNEDLARILVTNLLKNAYLHTDNSGWIVIYINNNTLTFKNSGNKPLDSQLIFDRFYKNGNKEESAGMGLAIVRSICQKYDIQLDYNYHEGHVFVLKFSKNKIRS